MNILMNTFYEKLRASLYVYVSEVNYVEGKKKVTFETLKL